MKQGEIERYQLAVLKFMALKGGVFNFDYSKGHFFYYWRQSHDTPIVEAGPIQDLLAELTAQG